MKKTIYDTLYIVFIDCLKQTRNKLSITQEQLATLLERDQSYISKYERCERRLDFIELLYICKALGIDIKEFLKDYENELFKRGIGIGNDN